ncbi:aldo/keto reductase [Caldifermentibacillus hisashii]|uniref:aldo/keto reductase n=1 Tax=Caldifermentibacillus hisashii TaxID=996558 RepID=UPI0031B74F6C
MEYITLNNGLKMPQLGFGVWQVSDEQATPAVKKALEVGYRSIDTAMIYGNEKGVGRAIKESKVPREELFITTKVWNADHGYDNTLTAFDASLERLGLDYIDLYLIHWPTPKYDQYVDTYKAMEKIYKDGRAKAIGVCNFDIEHLERLLNECEVVPVVNQVERHPYFQQRELQDFCEKHHIIIEAYSPLMNGKDVLNDSVVKEIAKAHGKTAAQVILRWHLQTGVITIPKSVTPSRIEENFDVFDFELTAEDMEKMTALDRNLRIGAVPSEFNKR